MQILSKDTRTLVPKIITTAGALRVAIAHAQQDAEIAPGDDIYAHIREAVDRARAQLLNGYSATFYSSVEHAQCLVELVADPARACAKGHRLDDAGDCPGCASEHVARVRCGETAAKIDPDCGF